MKKRAIESGAKFIISFFAVAIFCQSSIFGQKKITRYLSDGPYKVGYNIDHVYDNGRSFFPKYDYDGKKTSYPMGRPMQVSIWYPTNDVKGLSRMTFGDYIRYSSSEIDFSKNTEEEKNKKLDQYISGFDSEVQPEIENILDEKINVFFEAEIVHRDLPIVLFAQPLNTSAYDSNIICEYLASKGYLVLSVYAKGAYSGIQDNSTSALYVQVEDLSFLLDYAKKLSTNLKIATIGFSRGGTANLLFAEKNKNVDATISLDGSIFSQGWLDEIQGAEFYEPEKFSSNLLMITKNLKTPNRNPATFYDQVIYGNKSFIRYDHESHFAFSPTALRVDYIPGNNISKEQRELFYKFSAEIAEYSGEFLDKYLLNTGDFKEHKNKSINHSFEISNGFNSPPNPASLGNWILDSGMSYVNDVIEKVLTNEPNYLENVDWRHLLVTSKKLQEMDKPKDALETLKLADRILPDWYMIRYEMGLILENMGRQSEAITEYQQALESNPRHKESINRLTKLGAYQNPYKNTKIDRKEWEKYVGIYDMEGDRYKEISIEDDTLYLSSNYWPKKLKIWPFKKGLFLVEEDQPRYNLQIIFEFSDNGEVASLRTKGLNSGNEGTPSPKL